MDSLTQALLGGAVALAVSKGKAPRRALLYGAVIGTLPDLDTFISNGAPLDYIVSHRTWSHSWPIQSLAAPLIALFIHKFDTTFSFARWWMLIWLALVTHSGLDALTVFGTDLFWPFANDTVIGGSIFIIDPSYTLFLLLSCSFALLRPHSLKINRFNLLMLCISSMILIWGLGAQAWIKKSAQESLNAQNIDVDNILVQATPFNTLLWRVVAINSENYYQGFSSVFDKNRNISFTKHPRNAYLLNGLERAISVKQIDHFGHGYYSVSQSNQDIIMNDLRMGLEPNYTFRFKVAEREDNHSKLIEPASLPHPPIPNNIFNTIWRRIFDQSVKL